VTHPTIFIAPTTPLSDEMEYEGGYMPLRYVDIVTLMRFLIQETRREITKMILDPPPRSQMVYFHGYIYYRLSRLDTDPVHS
jgi:hypothetical protein